MVDLTKSPAASHGESLLFAALDCPHKITADKIILRRSDKATGNATHQLRERLNAALRRPAPGGSNAAGGAAPSMPDAGVVGEWVMVPREPTEAMISAGDTASNDMRRPDWSPYDIPVRTYRAMLAAAPSQPSPAVKKRGIYIASKTVHADRWRKLRLIGYPIISTWIDEAGPGQSQDLDDLWQRCIAEASAAEVLVLYRQPSEVLKGGWIELGAALASGTAVFAVGIEVFTIANDKRIRHFATMAEAMAVLKPMVNGTPFASLPTAQQDGRAGT